MKELLEFIDTLDVNTLGVLILIILFVVVSVGIFGIALGYLIDKQLHK